jgi:CelD/BcsL family acetyltransferase involved in cellulose biosynthesis
MQAYVASWERLANKVAEPNVFFEPWMLLPALRHFAPRTDDVEVLLVLDHGRDAPEVVGVVPLQTVKRFRGLPLRFATVWQHPQCYLCTPLMERGLEEHCWSAILDWMSQSRGRGSLLEMADLSADGPVFRALIEVVQRRKRRAHISGLYTRSLLEIGADADAYFNAYVKRGDWSNWQRKRRRLDETGEVRLEHLSRRDDLDQWLKAFLELEQSGWKGRQHSAINCSAADRAYYAEVTREAFLRDRFLATSLKVDGHTIAAQFDISAGPGAFSLKVAYDERYARFSPGILLSMEVVRRLHKQRTIRWLDSCTAPGEHPTRHLWGQWRLLASIVLPTGSWGSELAVSLVPAAKVLLGRRA